MASLLKGDGGSTKVYLVSNGEKRHISDSYTFNFMKFNPDKIQTIKEADLDQIATGKAIKIDEEEHKEESHPFHGFNNMRSLREARVRAYELVV